ncbi:MAG: hypothetical protein M0P12_00785 [Paludibacteraceae bacterium]|nr:hypothetical protein [Paludibacteraceae bacterium]
MNFKQELRGIGEIIKEAGFFERLREAATSISSHVVVAKNDICRENIQYVIKCAKISDCENIRKRLSSIEDFKVEKLSQDILGVSQK